MKDDRVLAARAATGDASAFSALVTRHEARLRGFLGRVAGFAAAEDLAQETFLKAWRDARLYRGDGSYAGWLLRIGWRLFLDDRRRARAEERRHAALETQTHANPDVEARVTAAAVLAALPPEERACLVLCFGQGFSHREAASMLDMPLGSVKTRVSRAATRARAFLETP